MFGRFARVGALGRRLSTTALLVIAALVGIGVVAAAVTIPALRPFDAGVDRKTLTAGSKTVSVDTKTWYVIVNRHSGKVVVDHDRDISEKAKVSQQTRNDKSWQQWQFIRSGDGYYRLRNQHSNKVLSDANNPFVDGGEVAQAGDHDGVEQQWRLVQSRDGYVRLVGRVSKKALQVANASTVDGAVVDQGKDEDAESQQWRLVPVGSADYPEPEPLQGGLTTHDPAVIKLPDGTYLLAGTGNGIGLKTSPDRVEWTDVGEAFPKGTPWARPYTDPKNPDLLWAPDLFLHNGRYYMYYAASNQGSFDSAIFLATSPTGKAGSWTHHGLVIRSHQADGFNAIDPNLVVDDQGRWWLAFGSYGSGIKMVRLDPATGMRLDTKMLNIADRSNDSANRLRGSEEAAFIIKHGSYYYLYMSFDHCCNGSSSDYRVMVARSSSATGPYVDKSGLAAMDGGGTEILAGHGEIHGPGHQAVLPDSDGDILFYHYYSASGQGEPACGYCTLGINHLRYDSQGWPSVQ